MTVRIPAAWMVLCVCVNTAWSQDQAAREHPLHHEVPDDAYRPLVPLGQLPRTTAGAIITRGRFTSVQVNVDANGDNIVGTITGIAAA